MAILFMRGEGRTVCSESLFLVDAAHSSYKYTFVSDVILYHDCLLMPHFYNETAYKTALISKYDMRVVMYMYI